MQIQTHTHTHTLLRLLLYKQKQTFIPCSHLSNLTVSTHTHTQTHKQLHHFLPRLCMKGFLQNWDIQQLSGAAATLTKRFLTSKWNSQRLLNEVFPHIFYPILPVKKKPNCIKGKRMLPCVVLAPSGSTFTAVTPGSWLVLPQSPPVSHWSAPLEQSDCYIKYGRCEF